LASGVQVFWFSDDAVYRWVANLGVGQ
jgi:hypothetical protein